jgi:hypothetical protein
MKLLLDTNLVIPAEPTSEADVTVNTRLVSVMLGEAQQGGHDVFVHPNIRRDLAADSDHDRRTTRESLLLKYRILPNPPAVPQNLRDIIGWPAPSSHDEVDDELLAAVFLSAVDFLVTEDNGIHRKAEKANLSRKVVTIDEMLRSIRTWGAGTLPTLPAVTAMTCDQLDLHDSIFDSLRNDYTEFESWLAKCRVERRHAWVISDRESYSAICIAKHETSGEHKFTGLVLKLCTFKIAETGIGHGYSELLLHDVLNFAFNKDYDSVYLEILPRYKPLTNLLRNFGFSDTGCRTHRGELVYQKLLKFSSAEYNNLTCLEFHIKYGPKHIKLEGAAGYVIPIRPQYHGLLFPNAQLQPDLLPGQHPFGNAIRKAYLCHSPRREIEPGSLLLFYRSRDESAVRCVGVAEGSRRSSNPDDILRYVSIRTVYSIPEIEALAQEGDVLCVLFRYARQLASPITLKEMRRVKILTSAPQSIISIGREGMEWLRKTLL